MDEHNDDMRNMILSELIDKMHGRMADKMFPPDPDKADQPAAAGITQEGTTATGMPIPRSSEHLATETDEHASDMPEHGDDEMTEEELDELMKSHVK